MISISRKKTLNGRDHKFFTTDTPSGIEQFSATMSTFVWSPIVWHNGVRCGENFLSCKYLALDFDDGKWSVDDAKQWVTSAGFAAIIGTSKSHQKEKKTPSGKVSPPCDRFRVVIPFSETIKERELYEYNVKMVMEDVPVDPSCKDGARYFYPSPVVFSQPGDPYPVRPFDANYRTQAQRHKDETERLAIGVAPAWALRLLMYGHDEGGRHKACYRLGATLIRCGWSEDEIVAACADGPLSDIGLDDIRRAVENGAAAAGNRDTGEPG